MTKPNNLDRPFFVRRFTGLPALANTLADLQIDAAELPLAGDNSYGYLPLRRVIAERYGVYTENVLSAQGTSMANFLLLAVQTNPGDVLLVETPVYECISYPARAIGARIVPFERREEGEWALNVEEIISLAYATGARGIVLSNPHNPSGQYTGDQDLIRLAEGVGMDRFVLVDEVYREGLLNQAGRSAALKASNLFVTSSLTKVWGLGSLRAGWAIASHDVIKKAQRAYDHLGIVNPFPTEWIAHHIFSHEEVIGGLREKAMQQVADGREHLNRFLSKRASGKKIRTVMPEGGGFTNWRLDKVSGDAFAEKLYEEEGVIITPGRFFGSPENVRIAWTQGPEVVVQALHRIDRWITRNL